MSDAPPEDLQRKIKSDPRYYMMNYWRHPSNPQRNYDFKTVDEEPLYYLTHEKSPLNPDMWGGVNVLLFCRGGLKTTATIGIANWAIDMYPNIEVDMTAPRDDQTTEFVERLKEKVEQSGLVNRRVKDNQRHQKFKSSITDSHGNEHAVFSHFKQRSGWGEGDAFRGLHGHVGIIDEFQDADEEMFSNFAELVDQKLPGNDIFPTMFIIGTPKMKSSFYHRLWELSDQKTWDKEKEDWIAQSESETWGDDNDATGTFEIRGWHLDAPNCPLKSESKIQFKKQEYSERRFKNEVMAKFYSPEQDLLTHDDVDMALDSDLSFRKKRMYSSPQSTVILGVDWGGGRDDKASDTVMVVGEKYENEEGEDEIRILNIRFLDASLSKRDEQEAVEDWVMKYSVDKAIVDYGHGSTRLEALQDGEDTYNPDGWKKTIKGCHYGTVKYKSDVKWETKTGSRRFFTCDRSHMMESFVDDFKNGEIVIPSADLDFSTKASPGMKIYNQLTAPYIDKATTPGGKKKLKIMADRNDDACHAFTYMWIGMKKLSTNRINSISSHKSRGY